MLGRIRTNTNSADSAYHIETGVWFENVFVVTTISYIHFFHPPLANSAELRRFCQSYPLVLSLSPAVNTVEASQLKGVLAQRIAANGYHGGSNENMRRITLRQSALRRLNTTPAGLHLAQPLLLAQPAFDQRLDALGMMVQ